MSKFRLFISTIKKWSVLLAEKGPSGRQRTDRQTKQPAIYIHTTSRVLLEPKTFCACLAVVFKCRIPSIFHGHSSALVGAGSRMALLSRRHSVYCRSSQHTIHLGDRGSCCYSVTTKESPVALSDLVSAICSTRKWEYFPHFPPPWTEKAEDNLAQTEKLCLWTFSYVTTIESLPE